MTRNLYHLRGHAPETRKLKAPAWADPDDVNVQVSLA